jgi:hypothetical protein
MPLDPEKFRHDLKNAIRGLKDEIEAVRKDMGAQN